MIPQDKRDPFTDPSVHMERSLRARNEEIGELRKAVKERDDRRKVHFDFFGCEWPESGDLGVAIVRLLADWDKLKAEVKERDKRIRELEKGHAASVEIIKSIAREKSEILAEVKESERRGFERCREMATKAMCGACRERRERTDHHVKRNSLGMFTHYFNNGSKCHCDAHKIRSLRYEGEV